MGGFPGSTWDEEVDPYRVMKVVVRDFQTFLEDDAPGEEIVFQRRKLAEKFFEAVRDFWRKSKST
jgi:hypothetical protein